MSVHALQVIVPQKLFIMKSRNSFFPSNTVCLTDAVPEYDDIQNTIHLQVLVTLAIPMLLIGAHSYSLANLQIILPMFACNKHIVFLSQGYCVISDFLVMIDKP